MENVLLVMQHASLVQTPLHASHALPTHFYWESNVSKIVEVVTIQTNKHNTVMLVSEHVLVALMLLKPVVLPA